MIFEQKFKAKPLTGALALAEAPLHQFESLLCLRWNARTVIVRLQSEGLEIKYQRTSLFCNSSASTTQIYSIDSWGNADIQWLCIAITHSVVTSWADFTAMINSIFDEPSWADDIAPDNRRNMASRSSSVFRPTAPHRRGGTRLRIRRNINLENNNRVLPTWIAIRSHYKK